MKYEGKLYGKVGRKTIPLILNSNDVDQMEREIERLRKVLRIIAGFENHPAVNHRVLAIEALRVDHK